MGKVNKTLQEKLSGYKGSEKEESKITPELSRFINTVNVLIFGIDNNGFINEWNQTAERITGFGKEDVIGRKLVEEFVLENFRAKTKKVLDKALKGENTAGFEFPLYTRDGRRVTILLNTTTQLNTRGNITGVTGIGQDITELNEYREKAQNLVEEKTEELHSAFIDTAKAKDRIEGILKSVDDGIIVTDTHSRVVLMNRAAEVMLGIRFSEIKDKPIDKVIDDRTLCDKVKTSLDEQISVSPFDFKLSGDDSEFPRIMRARTSAILDRENRPLGIITIILDMTREIELDRMKTGFLSTVAHELRTPLTFIRCFSEILLTREGISKEKSEKFLSYINSQALNMANTVNELLNISRIESGREFALNKIVCDAGALIKKVIPYFQEISTNNEFEILLPDEPVEWFVDNKKMEQVLINLLSNSIKYSPDGGVIRVVGEICEDSFQVTIEDQGIGMSPEQVDKIFDKFYRSDDSETSPEGTGLGMAIVKKIVESHDGNIRVESELGKGTAVKFAIPFRLQ